MVLACIEGELSSCLSEDQSVRAISHLLRFSIADEVDVPLQMLPCAMITKLNIINVKRTRLPRTAVSSIFLSSASHFPPGSEVSPAYVRSVADLLNSMSRGLIGMQFGHGGLANTPTD